MLGQQQACLQVLRVQAEHQLPQVRDRGRQRGCQRQRGRYIHQLAHAQQPAPDHTSLTCLNRRSQRQRRRDVHQLTHAQQPAPDPAVVYRLAASSERVASAAASASAGI